MSKQGIIVSRRYVAKVMKALSLKSKYTVKRYKNHSKEVNSVAIANVLQRNFTVGVKANVIVADDNVFLLMHIGTTTIDCIHH